MLFGHAMIGQRAGYPIDEVDIVDHDRDNSLPSDQLIVTSYTRSVITPVRKAYGPTTELKAEDIRLTTLLGTGGFGSVYKGFLGEIPVAVKRMHAQTKNESAKDESFKAELNTLTLKHPNIVAALTASAADSLDGAFIIMEFAGDRNLYQVINNLDEPMDHFRRVRYSADLAKALRYIHSTCVVHLDVKPSNIIVSPDDVCKLGDFGCCQIVEEGTGIVTPTQRSHLTGTFAYRAPELLRGEPPSTKADIYAFGVTLWQMLTRELPYGNENQHVVIFAVVAYNLRPTLPPPSDDPVQMCFSDLFVQCWDADPQARPNAQVLEDVLDIWIEHL